MRISERAEEAPPTQRGPTKDTMRATVAAARTEAAAANSIPALRDQVVALADVVDELVRRS